MLFPAWTHLCASLSFLIILLNAEITAGQNTGTNGGGRVPNPPGGVNQDKGGGNPPSSRSTGTGAPPTKKPQPPGSKAPAAPGTARQYEVPRKLPLMSFTLPQTYAGLIDVSEKSGVVNNLFFWFVPTQNPAGRKDLALWSNGGPGCSSLIGAFQENGPIMWAQDQKTPKLNPNSWHNQANMLYLEHPFNVGYSRGSTVINNEDQVARYIFVFLQKFIQIFPQMRGANFYFTGEEYAGLYISYAAQYVYRHQAQLALNLQGILLVGAQISIDAFQTHAPTLRFIKKWNDKFLKLSPQVIADITKQDEFCGASKYIVDNMRFPAKQFPANDKLTGDLQCQIWNMMASALPGQTNVLNIAKKGATFDFTMQSPNYFDRPDVRKAFHVEKVTGKWARCADPATVFPNGDSSLVPVAGTLPFVMSKNKRTVILHGEFDGKLLSEGATLSLQGFLWNGKFGFEKPIDRKFMVGGKQKGLFVADAGRMLPQDQPEAAVSAFQYLLGRRKTL